MIGRVRGIIFVLLLLAAIAAPGRAQDDDFVPPPPPEDRLLDESRVLARDEENVTKAQAMEVFCLSHHLIDGQCRPEDGRIAGKSAVFAVVDALVGNIERSKKPHGFAEMTACRLLALTGELFQ